MYKCVTNSGEFHKTKNPYIYVCVCVCVYIIFGHNAQLGGSQFPNQGLNPGPQ